MERLALSVTELNNRVKSLLDSDPILSEVCVRGELSNYKTYPSGHHYFALKDSESSLRCVMFKSNAVRLRFRPENGMNVIVFGYVSVFPRDGAYQLYASAILPIGAGDLQAAFEQLKVKLSADGLFDEAHKKKLPGFPGTIAVITSPAGAAVHDIIRILGCRWPMAKILLLPVRVQGEGAAEEIANALNIANKYSLADLIITGRGGGSIEDLWAFNEECVAKAVYESNIPVISAVGHEPDVTISDYVADMRASTPSNAAEIAVPDIDEIEAELSDLQHRLMLSYTNKLLHLRRRINALAEMRTLRDPVAQVDIKRAEVERLQTRLVRALRHELDVKKHNHVQAASSIEALSPLRVLTRGYSYVTDESGAAVKSIGELQKGSAVRLTLCDGIADCTVDRVFTNIKEISWQQKS